MNREDEKMESELLVCNSSYGEWLTEVEAQTSIDYHSIADLMAGVNGSGEESDELVLPDELLEGIATVPVGSVSELGASRSGCSPPSRDQYQGTWERK